MMINKKKLYFTIFGLILIVSLVLRLTNINTAHGFWHDEITIYSIGSKHFLSGMLNADLHRFLLFPLYFIFYKIWLVTFGNGDTTIRLMSVFFDMLSVICVFFVAKEFAKLTKNKEVSTKMGLFTSAMFGINSILIYYAQEAKFYAISLFFINLMILFWLKFLQNRSNKNLMFFLIFNFLTLYTYTSQIVLLIILQIFTILYLKNQKCDKKDIIRELIGFMIILIPILLITMSFNGKYFSGNFDAVSYDNSFFLLVLQNFFSPILNGLQNNVLDYEFTFLLHIFSLKWWLFIFFPIIFSLCAVTKSFRQNYISKIFVGIFLVYFFFHSLLSVYTNYGVLVRYLLPTLPFVLIVCSDGICTITRRKLGVLTFMIFIFCNLYILFSPLSATQIQRPNSYKDIAMALELKKIPSDSNFILPFRKDLLDKYYYVKGERLTLYELNSTLKGKTKNELKPFFLSNCTQKIEQKILKEYILPLKQGQKLVYVEDTGMCFLNDTQIKKVVNNSKTYQKSPLQILRMSKLNNIMLKTLQRHLSLNEAISYKNWIIYVYQK